MTRTHRTKGKEVGHRNPKGKCDMCRKNDATHWFGQTSVALCDDEACIKRNQDNWDRMIEDMEDDNRYS